MARKKIHSNILGIIILLIGVIIGVILVMQTQEFRNKAKGVPEKIYTICHKTEDPYNPWQEIQVSQDELSVYINQGDIFGNCP